MPHKIRHLTAHSKRKTSGSFERFVLVVAIVEPLMTIPQIVQIYAKHNTGISLITWVLYLAASSVWLIYGLRVRNLPIIITDILWIIMEAAVVVGALTR